MFGSDRSANFVIAAKDAASGTIRGVGKSMGSLKKNGVAAFKAIAAASIAAAGAIAGFALAAIKSAAEDEQQSIRLNAALKARGFNLDKLTPAVEAQIKAMQRLGFEDSQVRDGLEVGSRFFSNQKNLLKANAVAANIAAATGKDLSTVMLTLGRAVQGSTRGLNGLGIEVEKGAKLKDILRAADEKYAGVAEELANSTSGRFRDAQIGINEAFESFGYKFLPKVNEALTFFKDEILPQLEPALADFATSIGTVTEAIIGKNGLISALGEIATPILESLNPAFERFGDSSGDLFDNLTKLKNLIIGGGEKDPNGLSGVLWLLAKPTEYIYGKLTAVIDAINWVVNNGLGLLKALGFINEGDLMNPFKGQVPGAPGRGGAPVLGGGPSFGAGVGVTVGLTPVELTIGTQAQSQLSYRYGTNVNATTGTRNTGRGR